MGSMYHHQTTIIIIKIPINNIPLARSFTCDAQSHRISSFEYKISALSMILGLLDKLGKLERFSEKGKIQ